MTLSAARVRASTWFASRDFDEGGKLLGIEILEGDVLLRPETVEGATVRGGSDD